ncbi:MAG: GspE/PulE family protein [Planctomycetota bacterium]
MNAWKQQPPDSDAMRRVRRRVRAAEDRRQLVAGLLRALTQAERAEPEDIRLALAASLARLCGALEAQGVFLLCFEGGGVRVLAAHLDAERHPGSPDASRAEARRAALEGSVLPRGQLGFLADETWGQEPTRLVRVAHDLPPPRAIVQALGGTTIGTLIAVPLALDQERRGLLVATGPEGGDGFDAVDLEVAVQVGEVMAPAAAIALGLRGPLSEEEWGRAVARLAGCPFECGEGLVASQALLEELGSELLQRFEVLPLAVIGPRELRAAVENPLDWSRLADFEAVSGYRLGEKVVAPGSCIREQLGHAFPAPGVVEPTPMGLGGLDLDLGELDALKAGPSRGAEQIDEHSPPIVRLANKIIEEAHQQGASDIHLEVDEAGLKVRFRLDGICHDAVHLPRPTAGPLVARLKIMSELDIAEHRLPQDGRIHFAKFNPALDLDLRVSVVPLLHGEGVVMRLLDKQRVALPLEQLGLSAENLRAYRRVIRSPYGMILHCGPTGSGKSMSLYSALNELSDPRWKVLTAEDPIEYTLPGINQLQVKPGIGLTFAAALRSFLRHDPDIILVGEIRDAETAKIAVEAALTGHLLLSTLHTNDAAGTIPRLNRLDIEPFMLANTLIAVCAQRLVRKLCLRCREERAAAPSEVAQLMLGRPGRESERVYRAVGCDACRHTGYRGRTGIHELMLVNSRLRQVIGQGATAVDIRLAAQKHGMRSLFQDAMEKVDAGTTSMEEALRVTSPDEL